MTDRKLITAKNAKIGTEFRPTDRTTDDDVRVGSSELLSAAAAG